MRAEGSEGRLRSQRPLRKGQRWDRRRSDEGGGDPMRGRLRSQRPLRKGQRWDRRDRMRAEGSEGIVSGHSDRFARDSGGTGGDLMRAEGSEGRFSGTGLEIAPFTM